jgi:hypothetical protein
MRDPISSSADPKNHNKRIIQGQGEPLEANSVFRSQQAHAAHEGGEQQYVNKCE